MSTPARTHPEHRRIKRPTRADALRRRNHLVKSRVRKADGWVSMGSSMQKRCEIRRTSLRSSVRSELKPCASAAAIELPFGFRLHLLRRHPFQWRAFSAVPRVDLCVSGRLLRDPLSRAQLLTHKDFGFLCDRDGRNDRAPTEGMASRTWKGFFLSGYRIFTRLHRPGRNAHRPSHSAQRHG